MYCAPDGHPCRSPETLLSDDEIIRAVRILALLGLRKIRLTGGEPTLRDGVEDLVARLKSVRGIGTLGMTTNGVLLPRKAAGLLRAGLSPSGLNISLDTLRPERFARIAGRDRFADVIAGIEAALSAGFSPLKLNTVVMAGVNDDELCDFVEFAGDRPINIRFIEYMPFTGNHWTGAAFLPYRAMLDVLRRRYHLIPSLRAARSGAVAKDFVIPGHPATVSFISPLSADFCHRCTRLRLTADGGLKTCLFRPVETNLRSLMRCGLSDEAIADEVRAAVATKPAHHPPVAELLHSDTRRMVEIGG